MPFPNFHAARIADPGRFVRFRIAKNRGGRGIDFVFGFKSGGGSELQAVRFDKKLFSVAKARKWLKDRGFRPIKFEPATEESKVNVGEFEDMNGIEEVGRRNSSADAASINAAIRALLSLLDEEDLDGETLLTMHAMVIDDGLSEGGNIEEARFTEKPWDGSKSRFTIQQLLRSVPRAIARWAIAKARREGRDVIKDDLHLPYKEPDGTINLNAVRNARARLNQVKGVPRAILAQADRELQRVLAAGKKALGKEGVEADKDDAALAEAWSGLPGETFSEAFASPLTETRIDKERLIIRNVQVLGPVSANGRKYPPETQRKALLLLEGVKAYLNHPRASEVAEPRDVKDLIGEHRNVRVVGDRTVSDMHLVDTPLVRDYVLPIAESKPHLFGNSIVARGKMRKDEDGSVVVEDILAVRSVDLVAEPATTSNLFAENKSFRSAEETMNLQDLTVEILKKERPDLIEAILSSKKEEEKIAALESENKKLKDQLSDAEKKITEFEVKEARREKDLLIERIVREAKLPDKIKYEDKNDGTKQIRANLRSLLERCESEEEMKQVVADLEEAAKPSVVSEEKKLDFAPVQPDDNAVARLYRAWSS